jgi:hypothetical protein
MRRDGVLEFQEVSENMFLCPTKGCHLRTTGGPANDRDEGHDQQLAEVMAGIIRTGIGDAIESSEEDFHGQTGLLSDAPHPRIHHMRNLKTVQNASASKRDSPA